MSKILLVALLLSSSIFFGLTVISWRRRANPGALTFSGLMLASGIYSLGYCMEIQGSTIQHIYTCLRFEYLGISFIPGLWLLFCIQYAGKQKWLNRYTLTALFIIPFITVILVNTNNYHHLHYQSISIMMKEGLSIAYLVKGPWYWVLIIYENLAIFCGGLMILIMGILAPATYRWQYLCIFLASLCPGIGLGIYLSGNSPLQLDLTPFSLTITGLLSAWGLFRYRLFDLVPVARSTVFETMRDGVLVVDRQNRIVDINKPVTNMFNIKKDVIGRTIDLSFNEWPDFTRQLINMENGNFEVQVNVNNENRWIGAQVSPLLESDGYTGGRLIMLRDITKRKDSETRMEEINIELLQRIQELHQHNEEIRQINEMSSLLQACSITEEAYPLISRQMQMLFPQLCGGLYIGRSEANVMKLVAEWNIFHPLKPFVTTSECQGLVENAVHYFVKDEELIYCEHINTPLEGSYLCIPLIAQDVFGLLHLACPNSKMDDEQLQLARTATDSILLALSNLKMREILQQQSIRDPLTNLFNRRYMEETLQRELGRAERNCDSLATVMMDIDHFKDFNDRYGHLAGDMALRSISQVINQNVRSGDIVCRYGGEEFLLIMPGSSLEAAVQRAETLREKIELMPLMIDENTIETISISIGIAIYPEHGQESEVLLQAADTAMYHAKQSGRNRVMIAYR